MKRTGESKEKSALTRTPKGATWEDRFWLADEQVRYWHRRCLTREREMRAIRDTIDAFLETTP